MKTKADKIREFWKWNIHPITGLKKEKKNKVSIIMTVKCDYKIIEE